jgi:signal transduction histidine kinase
MERVVREPSGKLPIFLSTAPARRSDRRIALSVILISLLLFIVAVPFARVQLSSVWAVIPAYESALAINDLITATLLYVQFTIFRSPAMAVLAAGYLFCTFIAIPHALSFPISAPRRRVSGEDATRLVEGMATAAASMQGMFNALLDVSKLDAGAIEPLFADFPIEQVLARLALRSRERRRPKDWR